MAENKVEGEALKKLVKRGKKQRLALAYSPGGREDDTVLIDKRKKPEVLGRLARKESAGNKVAFGNFILNGRILELTCERTLPALAKNLKKYLKSQKLMLNVVVMDADGNVLESDVDDLPDDPSWDVDEANDDDDGQDEAVAAAETQDDGEQAPDTSALAARLKAVQPAIVAAQGDAAAKLAKVMKMAVTQIKTAELIAADKTITALEAAVAKLGGQPAPAEPAPQPQTQTQTQTEVPDIRALAARAQALKGVIAGITGAAGDKLMTALQTAAQQIKAQNLDAAGEMLGKIEAAANRTMAAMKDAPEPVAEPSEDARKWAAAEARLQPAIDNLANQGRNDLDPLLASMAKARAHADGGAHDKAMAEAVVLAGLIKAAAAAPVAPEQAPDQTTGEPEATTAETTQQIDKTENVKQIASYIKSTKSWGAARAELEKGVSDLISTIDGASDGVEGLERVPTKSDVLMQFLNGIDGGLENTLDQLTKSTDPTRRDALTKTALDLVSSYETVLNSDFFKAVDNNGFTNISIRANALASLKEVNTALNA